MSDIVKGLRGELLNCKCAAYSQSECCCDTVWPESLCNKAAAEIEKLRLELDMQRATTLLPSQKDDRQTIERLRAGLAAALEEASDMRAENEKLRAENETHKEIAVRETMKNATLRAALKPFAETAQCCRRAGSFDAVAVYVGHLRSAAAALKETDG